MVLHSELLKYFNKPAASIETQLRGRTSPIAGSASFCWHRSPQGWIPSERRPVGKRRPGQRRSQSYTSQIPSPWPSFLAVTRPPEPYASARHANGSLIIEMKLTHLTGRERGSVDEGENENSREGSRGEIRQRHVPFLQTGDKNRQAEQC